MRIAIGLAVALTLAGCGELPRPFQPENKHENALLLLPDRAGIAVTSVTGAMPDGPALAEAMAEALRRENVPAAVGVGNRDSRWLTGDVRPLQAPVDPTELRRRFLWELYDATGKRLGRVERTETMAKADWWASDPDVLKRIAADAAGEIAAMIQSPDVAETELPGYPPGTHLAVAPIAGGPPAFVRALERAMATGLRQRGLPMIERAQTGDVVIAGALTLGPEKDGQRPLELVWTIGREGREAPLGDLRQANAVAAARLSEDPERLADLIVRAALPGVLQVLERNES